MKYFYKILTYIITLIAFAFVIVLAMAIVSIILRLSQDSFNTLSTYVLIITLSLMCMEIVRRTLENKNLKAGLTVLDELKDEMKSLWDDTVGSMFTSNR